ncbi:hypothetical protein IGI39_002011 [Enterococcus sp. AZ135]
MALKQMEEKYKLNRERPIYLSDPVFLFFCFKKDKRILHWLCYSKEKKARE